MTGLTWVLCNEICTKLEDVDLVGGAEVFFAVDCAGDDGGEVAEAEVLKMAEIFEDLPLVFFT